MAVTVKAYFEKPGEETEIRRFALEAVAGYNKLAGQLTQVFASLQGKTFSLYWKDDDNDSIAFSSDQELTEALSFVKNGVFRVYIKAQDGQGGGSTGAVHPQVTCDGCEALVCGTRYKCIVCPDYDLCSGCQGKGLHTEHDMMAIRSPTSGHPWMFPPGGRPHCGPPGAHGPHGPHGPHGDPGQWGQMRRAWRRMWRQMMSQNPEANQEEAKADKAEKKGDGKAGTEAKPGTETKAGTEAKAESSDASDSQSEDYLKNVGESVALMLDPLGIDVEVDVEHKQRRKRCGRHGHPPPPPPPFNQWGPWGWGWGNRGHGGRWGHGRGRGCWWAECPSEEQSQQPPSQQDKPVQKPDQKPDQKPEQQKPAQDIDMKETSAETGEPQSTSGGAATGNTEADGPPSNKITPEDEWTLLGKEAQDKLVENMGTASTDAVAPPDGVAPHSGKLYPEIPHTHADPLIASALEQMYSMGFSNEGGWLTGLVEAMEGDINKVLDTIRPQRPPQ